MGLLEDALKILDDRGDRFRTIQATIRHTLNIGLEEELFGRSHMVIGRRKAMIKADPAAAKFGTSVLSLWIQHPSSARIESRHERDDGVTNNLMVTDGICRWECVDEGDVEFSEDEQSLRKVLGYQTFDIGIDRHFNPAQIRLFLKELDLEALGKHSAIGRECIRIRAVLKPEGSLWPHWLPKNADEYEFYVDVERGILLKIVSRNAGETPRVHEVTEVVFDEPIDPSFFCHIPTKGQLIRPKIPVVERLTMESAIARMPFTVLAPTQVPDPYGSRLEVHYHPPRRHDDRPRLVLMYHGSKAYVNLWIDQARHGDHDLDNFEWESLEADVSPQKDLRISDPGIDTGMRLTAFEQEGTHVAIWSDLNRETLIEMARSFVPAETPKTASHLVDDLTGLG